MKRGAIQVCLIAAVCAGLLLQPVPVGARAQGRRPPVVRWEDQVAGDLIRTYQSGRREQAIAALLDRLAPHGGDTARDALHRMRLWVHYAEKDAPESPRRRDVETLLILCTDALVTTWSERSLSAPDQNPLWQPLDFLRETVARIDPAGAVLRQWYLVWEAFRQSEISLQWRGWPEYLKDALVAFPRDPQMLLAAGSRQELEWWAATNPRRLLSDLPSARLPEQRSRLIAARGFLRRSLEANPAESESRLRLARVLLELGDVDGAGEVLAAQRWSGDEAAFEYLARLFEGEIAERRGDTKAALAAYDRAITLVPTPQSAQVAKAYVLQGSDRRADALQAATEALGGSDTTPDPWWVYSLGQAWRLSAYLRGARALVAR